LALPIGAFGAEAAHDASDEGVMAQLRVDWTVVLAQATGFLALFAILWFTVFRRVGGLLDRRRDLIAGQMEQLRRDREELDRLRQEARERLAHAEQEALRRLNAVVEESARERDAILAQAREGAQAELQRAREAIERETQAAILELRGEVADLAIQAAERILNEALDEPRHRRLVDELIQRLPEAE
jgi:F-type H+-transporting ATPase subunit b